MINIIDCCPGNLRSIENSLKRNGAACSLSHEKKDLLKADGIILPGVGSFGEAVSRLKRVEIFDLVKWLVIEKQKPILGICVGFQILFEKSDEAPGDEGLKIFEGKVSQLPASHDFKVPNIGWERVNFEPCSRLFSGDGYFYFANSYAVMNGDCPNITGCSLGTQKFAAAVERDNIFGVQFHPEKSQDSGDLIIESFIKITQQC